MIKAVLIKPLDGLPEGTEREFDKPDFERLVGMNAVRAVVDDAGPRTDGPTVAEYVAAGYRAENYPPEGYASRSTPEDIMAAVALQNAPPETAQSAPESDVKVAPEPANKIAESPANKAAPTTRRKTD